jgi:hypothetical protein
MIPIRTERIRAGIGLDRRERSSICSAPVTDKRNRSRVEGDKSAEHTEPRSDFLGASVDHTEAQGNRSTLRSITPKQAKSNRRVGREFKSRRPDYLSAEARRQTGRRAFVLDFAALSHVEPSSIRADLEQGILDYLP